VKDWFFQNCQKVKEFRRSSNELPLNSLSKRLTPFFPEERKERNFELELKANSFELL